MMRILPLLAASLVLYGCGGGRLAGSEREAEWDRTAVDAKKSEVERSVRLPAYPQDSDLLEFSVGSAPHRYFVDGKTLAVGADGVVRYTLVVRTAGGARNVSYEGIRCKTYEKRIYALGYPQHKWMEAKRSVWEPIQQGRANEHQDVLYKDFFCPDRIAASRDAIVSALRADIYGTNRPPD
ncbi:MAG: CNP1-like family protein [Burkholderiales bacterium]|nr:CNP1-like family protein [Burkholderiales bacterium]